MTHPLTDDIIESELATPAHFVNSSLVGLFTHDDMRDAADWQLEQVIEWLEYYPIKDVLDTGGYSALIKDFKEAMRPLHPEREHPIREDD